MADSPGLFTFTGFSPLSIAGCQMWLKADSLVLNNSDPVATWADQSGNGINATQTTAGNKPLYKTGIINGLPAVLFDGVDDFMSHSLATKQPLSVFIVVQPTLNTAAQKSYAMCIHGNQTGGSSFLIAAKLTVSFWGTFTTGDLSSTVALVSGSNYLLETTAASSSTFLYQRGTQMVFNATTELGTGSAPSAIGKDATNAGREYAGYIAEVLVYNTVLSSGNRVLVENYLISKYAL